MKCALNTQREISVKQIYVSLLNLTTYEEYVENYWQAGSLCLRVRRTMTGIKSETPSFLTGFLKTGSDILSHLVGQYHLRNRA